MEAPELEELLSVVAARRVVARPSRGQLQVPGRVPAVLAAPRMATRVEPVPRDAQSVQALQE